MYKVFLIWVVLQLISVTQGFFTGEYQSMLSITEIKLENLPPGIKLEWRTFIILMICAVASFISVVGLIFWQSSKNKKWATWILVLFSAFQVYNYAEAILRADTMLPDFLGVPYLFLDSIGLIIFLYVLYKIYLSQRNQTRCPVQPSKTPPLIPPS